MVCEMKHLVSFYNVGFPSFFFFFFRCDVMDKFSLCSCVLVHWFGPLGNRVDIRKVREWSLPHCFSSGSIISLIIRPDPEMFHACLASSARSESETLPNSYTTILHLFHAVLWNFPDNYFFNNSLNLRQLCLTPCPNQTRIHNMWWR